MSTLITPILIAVALTAGIFDLRHRRIPNWLTISGIALGVAVNAVCGVDGLTNALLGMGSALAIYLPLFLVRGMGAGDVKLMAAVGALAGPQHWFQIFITTAVLGGISALALVSARGRWFETRSNLVLMGRELLAWRSPADASPELDFRSSKCLALPHGTTIAIGVLAFLLLHGMA
jgi:prepilin peptidase CpaA